VQCDGKEKEKDNQKESQEKSKEKEEEDYQEKNKKEKKEEIVDFHCLGRCRGRAFYSDSKKTKQIKTNKF